jgi:excisionase family DNA binding protein
MRGTSDAYLTAREAAEEEHVSIDTIKRALKNGRLRGHQVGARRDWRIAVSDLQAWVAAGAPTKQKEDQV